MCSDCHSQPLLWSQRGKCSGPPTPESGADQQQISAEVAINLGAGHLGSFGCCPVGIIREEFDWIQMVFEAYSFLRRFGVLTDPTIEPDYLMVMDDEIKKIEQLERDDQRKIAELKRKQQRR